MITMRCPRCGETYDVPEHYIGKLTQCGVCGDRFKVVRGIERDPRETKKGGFSGWLKGVLCAFAGVVLLTGGGVFSWWRGWLPPSPANWTAAETDPVQVGKWSLDIAGVSDGILNGYRLLQIDIRTTFMPHEIENVKTWWKSLAHLTDDAGNQYDLIGVKAPRFDSDQRVVFGLLFEQPVASAERLCLILSGENEWLRSGTLSFVLLRPNEVESYRAEKVKIIAAIMADMELVSAGTFMMGAPESEQGRQKDEFLHPVTLTKEFWIGKHEVTQAQWEAVMGNNPSSWRHNGVNGPVESVSWGDCQVFLGRLNRKMAKALPDGYAFALPTEAQWEYACRAGSGGAYPGNGTLGGMGWYAENSEGDTHTGGRKAANAYGLFDMQGNVAEWCADWYSAYPGRAAPDPKGPASGDLRVVRGGAYSDADSACRCASRLRMPPASRFKAVGFRLAISAGEKAITENHEKETGK
jgi:formylglycine-generating enzyme required for sulfatase activity